MHCSLLENLLQLNRESFLKPLWSLVSVRQCLEQVEHTLGEGFCPPASRPSRRSTPARPACPGPRPPRAHAPGLCAGRSGQPTLAGLCHALSRAPEGLPLCVWLHLYPRQQPPTRLSAAMPWNPANFLSRALEALCLGSRLPCRTRCYILVNFDEQLLDKENCLVDKVVTLTAHIRT